MFLCIAITWLSTVGLPDSVIRSIEEKAQEEGVPISIEKICLSPSKGLALEAENIRIYADEERKTQLSKVDSVAVSLHASRLLTGEVMVDTIELNNGNLSLPVTDSGGNPNVLNADKINISAQLQGDTIVLTGAALKLQGIPINIEGAFSIAELMNGDTAEEETEKIVLPALIKACQHIIDRTYTMIQEQQWSNNEYPELHLKIFALDELSLNLEANVPKYDIGKFHFRETRLNLNYEGDRLLINELHFKTVKPTTVTVLKAGYEIDTRKASFELKSSADIIYMLTAISLGETKEMLQKVKYLDDTTPNIELGGIVEFEENFTLKNIDVKGNLEHKNFEIGDFDINEIGVAFFYKNGDFNISNLRVLFPDGKLNLNANVVQGKGTANITADLPIISTLSLINEFVDEPLALPIGLQLGDKVHLEASADVNMPPFQAGIDYQNVFVPTINDFHLIVKPDQLSYAGQSLTAPQFTIHCKAPRWTEQMTLSTVEELRVQLTAEAINLERPELGSVNITDASLKLAASMLNFADAENILSTAKTQFSLSGKTVATKVGQAEALAIVSTADNLKLDAQAAPIVTGTDLKVRAESYRYGELHTGNVNLSFSQCCGDNKENPLLYYLDQADLTAKVDNLAKGEQLFGNLSIKLNSAEKEKPNATISFTPHSDGADTVPASITTKATLTQQGELKLSELDAKLPLASMANMLECLGLQTSDIEMPKMLTLTGNVDFNTENMSFCQADVTIDIPELIRTPDKIAVFKGKRIPLGVHTTLQAHTDEQGDIAYEADLRLTHSTGVMDAHITGNTASYVEFRPTSNIRADIFDQIIDLEDSHSILRDFKFTDKSSTVLKNAVAKIDYSNGLRVSVDCDITVKNAQFQLNGIVVDDKGNEKLNPDMGKLPFVSVHSATTTLRARREEDVMDGDKVLPTINTITMENVKLVYDNKPWLAQQDFSALGITKQNKPESSELKGDQVFIDIENGLLKLKNVSGSVFPAYSIGMFYGDMRAHLADVLLPYPVQLSTSSCSIPIYSECKDHMSGNIRVQSDKICGFKFIGTTIPFTRFTGFINLQDDYIFLDRMNARCWDGTLDAAVKIGITGDKTSFDGQVSAQNMDLRKIAAAYKADMTSALCSANIRFRSPSPEVNDIEAYGKINVTNGDLLNLGIFHPIAALVSDVRGNLQELDSSAKKNKRENLLTKLQKLPGKTVHVVGSNVSAIPGYNHIFAYDLQDAFAEYTIKRGKLQTTKFKSTGSNLNVTGNLSIDLNTLELHGNMWPEISGIPTIILSPITFLSDFMVDIVLHGKLNDIQWKFKLDSRIRGSSPVTASSATPSNNPAPRKKQADKKSTR